MKKLALLLTLLALVCWLPGQAMADDSCSIFDSPFRYQVPTGDLPVVDNYCNLHIDYDGTTAMITVTPVDATYDFDFAPPTDTNASPKVLALSIKGAFNAHHFRWLGRCRY